ncbi:hypothetical protein [Brevibacillus reuszeri]|uniref:hypothetical protein n=1 Tax=Brevibacillus reuszeri TaxID=54915 RepID=UPI000CCBD799|nr:hypothetical protein [Brevibacillus reuszeri]
MKIRYKHDSGALHIGGGRFFHSGETYNVSDKEWKDLEGYEDLEVVKEDKRSTSNTQSVATSEPSTDTPAGD